MPKDIRQIFKHANPPRKYDHSKLSPSSGKMWMACAGSINLPKSSQIDLPPDEPSEYALEGTAAHWLAEKSLELTMPPIEILDRIKAGNLQIPEGYEQFIDAEMAQNLRPYFDHIGQEIKVGINPQWASSEFLIMQEVFFTHWLPELGDGILGGTIDALSINQSDKILRITDLKYGRMPVEVDANIQLLIYAILALGENNPGGFEQVKITIVQPRSIDGSGPIKSVMYNVDDLYRWHNSVLIPRIKEILGGKVDLQPDPDNNGHCKWCRSKAICPAYKALILSQQFKFDKDPESLSLEDLEDSLNKADAAFGWAKATKDAAKFLIQQGKAEFKGWTVRKTAGREKFKNPTIALADLLMVSNPEDICNLRTPAQLRSVIKPELVDEYVERGNDTYALIKSKTHKKADSMAKDDFGSAEVSKKEIEALKKS